MTSSSWQTRQAFRNPAGCAGDGAAADCAGCEPIALPAPELAVPPAAAPATFTCTRGTTFHAYPDGFHSWSSGWVLPAVSRARESIVWYSARCGVQAYDHWRHPNGVR